MSTRTLIKSIIHRSRDILSTLNSRNANNFDTLSLVRAEHLIKRVHEGAHSYFDKQSKLAEQGCCGTGIKDNEYDQVDLGGAYYQLGKVKHYKTCVHYWCNCYSNPSHHHSDILITPFAFNQSHSRWVHDKGLLWERYNCECNGQPRHKHEPLKGRKDLCYCDLFKNIHRHVYDDQCTTKGYVINENEKRLYDTKFFHFLTYNDGITKLFPFGYIKEHDPSLNERSCTCGNQPRHSHIRPPATRICTCDEFIHPHKHLDDHPGWKFNRRSPTPPHTRTNDKAGTRYWRDLEDIIRLTETPKEKSIRIKKELKANPQRLFNELNKGSGIKWDRKGRHTPYSRRRHY